MTGPWTTLIVPRVNVYRHCFNAYRFCVNVYRSRSDAGTDRLNVGRFSVDDEMKLAGVVLKLVNVYRFRFNVDASSVGVYVKSADDDRCWVMAETIDVITELAAQIADLRRRILELDAERVQLSEQLDRSLLRFSELTIGHTGAQPSRSIDPEIMRVFQRFPDRYLSPRDVAAAMKYRDLPHMRMRLSRMVKSKKLKRVGHGRYVANAPSS
jgi:hypothetical protein